MFCKLSVAAARQPKFLGFEYLTKLLLNLKNLQNKIFQPEKLLYEKNKYLF